MIQIAEFDDLTAPDACGGAIIFICFGYHDLSTLMTLYCTMLG